MSTESFDTSGTPGAPPGEDHAALVAWLWNSKFKDRKDLLVIFQFLGVPKMLFELICYMLKPAGDLFARTHMLNPKNKMFQKNWDIKST
jgi:hypothetical protein